MDDRVTQIEGKVAALAVLLQHLMLERAVQEPHPIAWLEQERENAITTFSTHAPSPALPVDPFGPERREAFERAAEDFFADILAAIRLSTGAK